jgi:NADH-quinone oxidoreductase subunit J
MVLFLFIIMLLNLKEEEALKTSRGRWLAGGIVTAGIGAFLTGAIAGASQKLGSMGNEVAGEAKSLGNLLFTQYLLPFEIMSVLLLVAMVGVVLLSKHNLK